MRRRLSVVSGIPVCSAAVRWEIPAAASASETVREISREVCSGVSMQATVVPKWNTCKHRYDKSRRRSKYLDGYLWVTGWAYRVHMATNSRQRSDWSDMVAAQIRAERAAADLTQREVMRRSGIAKSTYIRIEAGVHIADTTELARIAQALGVPLSELFRRVENRMRPT